MSEEIDELRKGGLRRILLVMAVLGAVGVAVVWARAAQDRGEPELAHRVLIVGGTPSNLVEVIAEAGFEATQISWDEAATECASADGSLDVEALIDCADERGDGFVALMFGDDMAFEPTILGEAAPEHADAAVVSVGELAPEQPRVHFGAPPHHLGYAPGMRRSEALRMALYGHPDLLGLWDDPTSEQIGQQVKFRDLDEARTLLAGALARYEAAGRAWPSDWPPDAIVEPWTEIDGMPVQGGRVVREVGVKVWVDEDRTPELRRGEARLSLVPDQGPAVATTIDPLADRSMDLEPTAEDVPPELVSVLVSRHPTTAGLHVVIDDSAVAEPRLLLLRLAEVDADMPFVELGMLPSFEPDSLVVAPDGTWIAWRSPGRARAIWAAAIVDDKLMTPVRLGEGSMDPQISADSQTALLTVERELPGLGPVHTLRIVPRPKP